MSKERYNQIIDEVYENYLTNFIPPNCPSYLDVQPSYYEPMTKEWFVKSIKEWGTRGEEFSQEWGLTIEERELSSEERKTLYREHCMKNFWALKLHGTTLHYEHCMKDFWDLKITEINEVDYEKANIPTRLITLTYNNETIITYEQYMQAKLS